MTGTEIWETQLRTHLGGRGSLLDRGGMSRVGAEHVLIDGGPHKFTSAYS